MNKLEKLRLTLLKATSKVFYATNEYDNEDNAELPFIVYQEINKKAPLFGDDKPTFYESVIQITLVTKQKDVSLETILETVLLQDGYIFEVSTEFRNSDKSLNRVYEVRLEDYLNGK